MHPRRMANLIQQFHDRPPFSNFPGKDAIWCRRNRCPHGALPLSNVIVHIHTKRKVKHILVFC
jgi:hypothetical protein